MTIKTCVVDHSALPQWPSLFVACEQMHRDIDPWHTWRMGMQGGGSLAPPPIQVHPLGRHRVILVEVTP